MNQGLFLDCGGLTPLLFGLFFLQNKKQNKAA
jgi:hypothetical protein